MADRLPSLDLVADTVRHERDLVVQHANALDAKAGVVLGFAGAVTAVASVNLNGWRVPGAVTAAVSALLCLPMFRPKKYPAWRTRGFRDRFINAEAVFTRLKIVDTEIEMADQAARILQHEARRLEWSVRVLLLAVLLLSAGTMLEYFGGR